MFLAPLLYAIHAVLTGAAMALMHLLNVHLGFGFSAGLFDYVLNFSKSTQPLLLIPIGLAYFALYYGLFRFFIVRFDLKTPGRELELIGAEQTAPGAAGEPALGWIKSLGGAGNLRSVEACTTRLRLVVADPSLLDEAALKSLGSRGVLRMADGAVQVVVGPIADQVASAIRAQWRNLGASAALPSPPAQRVEQAITAPDRSVLARVAAALGGAANIAGMHVVGSRLCVQVRDAGSIDEAALRLAVRTVARPAPDSIHLVIGPAARAWFASLKDV
jgi:PTS system N-acetylglucosamine-specific IIC component